MRHQRFVVMGAGEVGYHLARTLSGEGHEVSLIELDPVKQARVADELDVKVIGGNGAHARVLEEAAAAACDLFMAVSSSDEANLVASRLAKHLGATRSVVRVQVADEAITHRGLYEDIFGADLILSTELLTTTRVLNTIRGHSTMAVEYLADGKVQLRKIQLDAESTLARMPLREVPLPEGSLVVAFFRGDELIIPSGQDRAEPGDSALLLGKTDVIAQAERVASRAGDPETRTTVVIAGGGHTGYTVARSLSATEVRVKLIERERSRAKELAAQLPDVEILHGDATEISLLQAERIPRAGFFVALSGHDESNLMACLLAQDLGVPHVMALVHRIETIQLWKHLGLHQVFSPQKLAYERIAEYVESGYSANIVSLKKGAAQVVERRLHKASPAAGVSLADISPPRGLIVGTVVRDDKVFVPRGKDRLEEGDLVILFVREEELDTVRLLFPGKDAH